MWTYTCTACRSVVEAVEEQEARIKFHEHVRVAHPKAHTVLTTIVDKDL